MALEFKSAKGSAHSKAADATVIDVLNGIIKLPHLKFKANQDSFGFRSLNQTGQSILNDFNPKQDGKNKPTNFFK